MKNKKRLLFENGFTQDTLSLNSDISGAVMHRDFKRIDELFQKETKPEGQLFKYLSQYRSFTDIEFIISLRAAANEWEEDGIWHDDGSRVLAFSLSLTENCKSIVGGNLHIRKKGSIDSSIIKPFSFGEIIVFLTGTSGFEHKIHKVEKGERLIIAGWCS